MKTKLNAHLIQLAVLLAAALVAGLLIGYPASALLLFMLCYGLLAYRKTRQLFFWMHSGDERPPANLDGFWADVADHIYRDRRRIRKTQSRYEAALGRAQQISSAMRDGIIILNKDLTINWWNHSAETMLHLGRNDLHAPLGNRIRQPELLRQLQTRNFSDTVEYTPPTEHDRVFEISGTCFGTEGDEILLAFRDISNLLRLEKMRKDFVANISHELRTPLTVINGYVDNLQALLDEQHWGQVLGNMRAQCNRITALADDLTMLSRLESGGYQYSLEPVQLAELLQQVVDDARQLASDRHTINCTFGENLVLQGNYQQLYSAFSNLVVNAIRHNRNGCDITISARQVGSGVEITVADNGIGIASRHLPRLTERFYRTDTNRNSASGGTGLGLAIVKHVIQHHNGHLTINSSEGEGAAFVISL